jgi:hypothetical protein
MTDRQNDSPRDTESRSHQRPPYSDPLPTGDPTAPGAPHEPGGVDFHQSEMETDTEQRADVPDTDFRDVNQ